ncbi:MAG: oxidative damage protection protein [Pseudohongiellaceae bacterium]
MTRKVFCKKYQQELEGLPMPPYPGAKGQEIYDNISRKAWMEWQATQVRLINEKGLSMIAPEDRKYLMEEMDKFFANQDHDEAEGYVPPEQ